MTHSPVRPPSAQQQADQLAILEVLNRHCRALDRNDAQLLSDCYWPDASVDYGSFKGPAQDFAALVGPALSDAYELTRHCISNTLITFDGDSARAESYVQAGHLLHGGTAQMQFSGRYLDLLSKRDGSWCISHRQVVMDWSHTGNLTDERSSEAFAALSKGSRDGSDPLYPFLRGGDRA